MGKKLEQTLAVLNGLLGDYLSRTKNGLATELGCYHQGRPLALDPQSILRAHAAPGARAVVLVHGVMSTEEIFRFPDGSDYGLRLQQSLGYTPFYVRYNSGRPIADNGQELAALLTQLVQAYPQPLEELLLLGYSMGGLLLRRACHVAAQQGLPWLPRVRRALYVGTPHLGAPAERLGRVVTSVLHAIPDPYTKLVAELADLRSAGVKDLGDADLRHEDRADKRPFSVRDPRHPVPLLPSIQHCLIAGTVSADPRLDALLGDSIVPVQSASFDQPRAHREPQSPPHEPPLQQVAVLPGLSHLALAHDDDVYAQLERWCKEPT